MDEDSDYLDFGGDSDDDKVESESSEDELDILLNASSEQRRQLQERRRKNKVQVEDDFEREMNAELQERVTELEAQRSQAGQPATEEKPGTSVSGPKEGMRESGTADSTKFYDDIYFDSDDEVNDNSKDQDKISRNRKRTIPSNDDLLYDPNMDAEDERWVAEQRHGGSGTKKDKSNEKTNSKLPKSDAVLDCPACMTTLCRDCQRHDVYDNQYRAMFVSNCVVDRSELLKFPVRKGKKKKKKTQEESTGDESEDKYHPVKCRECNTVVAMYDLDEIYHFFNVLASYS